MTPEDLISDAVDALEDEDPDGAADALGQLADWLQSGGFWPRKQRLILLLQALQTYLEGE